MAHNIKARIIFIFLCITCAWNASCNSRKEEKHAIENVWNQYSNALASNNGELAATLIDSATTSYCNEILSLVKNADSNTVALLRIDQRFLVLAMRHAATPQKIESLDGRSFYAFMIQSGILQNMSGKRVITNIILDNNVAHVDITDTSTSKRVAIPLSFYKEQKQWRINFSEIYNSLGEQVWEQLSKNNNISKDSLIRLVIESVNDKKIDNHIWYPTHP